MNITLKKICSYSDINKDNALINAEADSQLIDLNYIQYQYDSPI